jgi:ATP adenylyltransferase
MVDEEHIFEHHLLAQGKLAYAKGTRPKVDCILCGIRDNDPKVESLKVYQDERIIISLNRYPYNPGHLMVIPVKHTEKFEELSEIDYNYLFKCVLQSQKLLQLLFNPTGFNVGYNQGDFSGASIRHIHVHVVPRYKGELGYIDIIGQTRVVVEGVDSIFQKIQSRIGEFFPFS